MAVTSSSNPTLALAGLAIAKQSQLVNAQVIQSAVDTAAKIAATPPSGSGASPSASSGAVDISV
jgi:hypothetical protein